LHKQTSELSTEQVIWQRIKNGEQNALKDLYELYHQVLFNYGRKMTTDTALVEDAIQDVFVSLWNYRRSTSVPVSVRLYMLRTMRNQILQIFKKRRTDTWSEEELNFGFEIGFDQKLIESEDLKTITERINSAVLKLTPRQREIIYYRFYENLSFDEIALIMNMQVRATYKLSARAILALKEMMHPLLMLILLLFFKVVRPDSYSGL
jgi:RNA polymerase sigma factor (sigma-70 family)